MIINRLKRLYISIFIIIACCLATSNANALDKHRYQLPNGLIVLYSENHNLPIVMITLIIKAGQINEPEEMAGLANLTAEMLLEGTKNRSSEQISEEIEFIGALLETSADSDYTSIKLSVLKKDLNKGFELFADVLLNPTFPQDEIERKREIIKGFLRQREEDPLFLAIRSFKKEVYGGHPYGRLIEGSIETINNIKRKDLLQFYKDYYLPNNSILSVAGDITFDELNILINKYLSKWEKADLPSKEYPKVSKKRYKRIIKIDRDITQANIILGTLGIRRDNPDYYAISVMNYILGGGGFSSRLMKSIRDEMGLAYDVHSLFTTNKEEGLFQVYVQTKNESANKVINEILKQIKRIKKEYVSDQELLEAKSYLKGSFPRRLDTNRKIANFLAIVEYYNLGFDYEKRYPEYIDSVTKEDVLRVAKEYLDSKNYILVIVANQNKANIKISGSYDKYLCEAEYMSNSHIY